MKLLATISNTLLKVLEECENHYEEDKAVKKLSTILHPLSPSTRTWLLNHYSESDFLLQEHPIVHELPNVPQSYIFILDGKETEVFFPHKDMLFYPRLGKKYLYRYLP